MTTKTEDISRLFDEVLQEISLDVRCMMEELWLNFSQLGVNHEEKVDYIMKLVQIEKELHKDVILETRLKLKVMEEQVVELEEETEVLSKYLSVDVHPILDFTEDMMLNDYKKELEDQIAGYREQAQQQRMKMEKLLEWQRDLAEKLGVIIQELQDFPLPSEEELDKLNFPLPSEEELDKLKARLEVLQAERDKRAEVFLNTQVEIKDIMKKLKIEPSNKFEHMVTSSLAVDFKVTDLNMDRLAKLKQELQEKYEHAKNRVLNLRERKQW